MKVEPIMVSYVDSMGSDTSVVNAARVSFAKEIEELGERDLKLIHYLARHKHWSPFAHTSLSLRIRAPIFLARQLVKHQVGGVWNEVSRRYVDTEPSFYIPDELHEKAESAKQGCGKVICGDGYHKAVIEGQTYEALMTYNHLLRYGVAPEEARMVLPLNTMTEWIWTGSLMFWFRVWQQRSDEHAQTVAREFAELLDATIPREFYNSWGALKDHYK